MVLCFLFLVSEIRWRVDNYIFSSVLVAEWSPIGKELLNPLTMFSLYHYANTPMQYTAIFHGCKNDNFQSKCFDYFHTFTQNIDCGYTLEPPH